jgi:hypothetical protein
VERCSDHQFIECGGGRFREERRYCLACVCVCEREREREIESGAAEDLMRRERVL